MATPLMVLDNPLIARRLLLILVSLTYLPTAGMIFDKYSLVVTNGRYATLGKMV